MQGETILVTAIVTVSVPTRDLFFFAFFSFNDFAPPFFSFNDFDPFNDFGPFVDFSVFDAFSAFDEFGAFDDFDVVRFPLGAFDDD